HVPCIKWISENHANSRCHPSTAASNFTLPSGAGAGNTTLVERARERKIRDATGVAVEDLGNDFRLLAIDFQDRANTRGVPVSVLLSWIQDRPESVTVWPTAAPKVFHRLPCQPPMDLLAQFVQPHLIDQIP